MVATHLLGEIISSIALVAVSGLFFEALSRLLRTVVRRAGALPITLRGIRDGLRIIWLAVALSGLFSIWGLASALTVVTLSGLAGLAISLALQAVLTNMISGFLLLRDGALRIGDRIEYSGIKGEVVLIALRNTWVRTEGGSIAIVGNSSLANGPLVNHTATTRFGDELSPTRGAPRQVSSTPPPVAPP
jgi:small conductance mechanosensitive channel